MCPAQDNDLGALTKSFLSVPPQDAAAGTINGLGMQRESVTPAFETVLLEVAVGAPSGTPTSYTVNGKLQDSADGTNFADITAAPYTSGVNAPAITTSGTNGTLSVVFANLRTLRAYVRAVVTVSFTGGTSPTVPVSSTLVFGGPDQRPAGP